MAVSPVSSFCIAGDNASYAAYMFANSVSPPISGRRWICSIVPSGGSSSHETSECQNSPLATFDSRVAWISFSSSAPISLSNGELAVALADAGTVKGVKASGHDERLRQAVLDVIKAQAPDLPVVMISGHGTTATAVDAIRSGAIDFLDKPLSSERVIVTLRHVLHDKPAVLPLNEAAFAAGRDALEALLIPA